MDDRAQSIGVARFFLSLVGASFVVWIVWEVANPILEHARGKNVGQTGSQATEWMQSGVDFIAITFLVIAVFGLLVLSIYQREVLR